MKKQFEPVPNKFGAPMGRNSYGSPEGEIHVFQVRMVDGDYDDGGAYWGGVPSKPLWCARNSEDSYRDFARAKDYTEALEELGLDPQQDTLLLCEDDVVTAYMECALWSESLEDKYSLDDFDERAWAEAEEDCGSFLAELGGLPAGWDASQFGHDFWLTRNGHGAGFWDRGHGELGRQLADKAEVWGSRTIYVHKGELYFD